MDPREVIQKTLDFDSPPRIPRQIWLLPWAQDHYPEQVKAIMEMYPDDIVYAPPCYQKLPLAKGDAYAIGQYIDEWGCEFENRQKGVIGEVKHPMIESLEDLSKIRPPEECLSVDVDMVNQFCRNSNKFVLGSCCPRPFERLQFLRGTENVMMDFALEPEKIAAAIQMIHQFHLKEYEIWAKTDVNGLMFMDDWGTQRSLLISLDMWRRFFKPLYQDYIDIAHAHHKKIFMHSDGYILDIFPDLIEMGLDAINSQIFCMGVDSLKPFAGKITFWGEIDRQYLLCEGTEQEIHTAVQSVYSSLYRNGGVIGQVDFGVGAKPEKVQAAFAAWEKIHAEKSATKTE
jgi:uroporphyrinogen decarboxylase